ncbi:MAG: hypothetical protein P4N59_18785 [Negativicutes bacterium]|nr:hypothetical protein [Negativicutes bacterium]
MKESLRPLVFGEHLIPAVVAGYEKAPAFLFFGELAALFSKTSPVPPGQSPWVSGNRRAWHPSSQWRFVGQNNWAYLKDLDILLTSARHFPDFQKRIRCPFIIAIFIL